MEFIGLLVLMGGFAGYWIYLELQKSPLLLTASPTPTTPKPTATPSTKASALPDATTPATPRSTPVPALSPDQELYQRSPKPGIYYAVNPELAASRREIVGSGDRFCIKLVNAVTPEKTQTMISSLSLRNDGIYIDATAEKLAFDRTYSQMTDRTGTWELLEGKQERSGTMEECLATKANFVRQVQE